MGQHLYYDTFFLMLYRVLSVPFAFIGYCLDFHYTRNFRFIDLLAIVVIICLSLKFMFGRKGD